MSGVIVENNHLKISPFSFAKEIYFESDKIFLKAPFKIKELLLTVC